MPHTCGPMKTLDRHFLSSHPQDDEKADISLSVPVPGTLYVPNNPDGTRPKITLQASGDTYLDILVVLSNIHDDESGAVLEALLADALTDEEMERYETLEAAAPLVKERSQEIVTPFRTFEFGFNLTPNNPTDPDRGVDLKLTTPSIVAGMRAINSLTKSAALTNLAVSLCPTVSDDDDYWDEEEREEVLVIGE